MNASNTIASNISRRQTLKLLAAATLLVSGGAWAGTVPPVPPKPHMPTGDPKAYGKALAQYAESYDSGWVDQFSKAKMTLIDARGDSVVREVTQRVLEGAAGDKSLIRFMRPAEIRGVAALIHENPTGTDDNWLYLPSSRRTRRISGANRTASFQGTEFTYEDLSSFTTSRYAWEHLGDKTLRGQPVYELQAQPTYADTGYSKLIVSINKSNWRVEGIEFFDLAGRRLKTYSASQWKTFHGRFERAMRIEMQNHQTGKRTLLESSSMLVTLSRYPKSDGSERAGLTAEHFSKRALENG